MGTRGGAGVTPRSTPESGKYPATAGPGHLPWSHARRSRPPASSTARLTKPARPSALRRHTVPAQLSHANSSSAGDAPSADTAASRTALGRGTGEDFTTPPSVACARGGVVIALPESPDAFKSATWEDLAPYYEELATRPLDKGNVEAWLRDWSDFESMLAEAAALAHFAYACNTADAESERAQLRFGSEIDPRADEQRIDRKSVV